VPKLKRSPLLIDAVVGNNEIDLFQLRHEYLSTLIDRHVIAESEFSFSGNPKPLVFAALKKKGLLPDNVDVWNIKIPKKVLSTHSQIEIQDAVRMEFARQLHEHFGESIFFFTDVDEIPSRKQVAHAASSMQPGAIMNVPMKMYFRRINWELLLRKNLWRNPKVFFGKPPTGNIRSHPPDGDLGGAPGGHFSFLMMSSDELLSKFQNYGHQEYNRSEFWSDNLLEFCDLMGLDHLGRANRYGLGLLKSRNEDELSEVGKFLSQKRPSWLGVKFRVNPFRRLLSAQTLWRAVHLNGEPPSTQLKLRREARALGDLVVNGYRVVYGLVLSYIGNSRKFIRRCSRSLLA
jgi:hypothetical protein